MSPVATDSCGPDGCSQTLTTALDVVLWTMLLGGVLTSCARLTSWLPPWRALRSTPGIAAAFLSLAPPLSVVLLVFDLPGG